MVEVDDLCLRLGRRKILDGVSFRLRDGETTALLGRNGSGKSSLIRCLCSYYGRYGGKILYDGRELGSFPASQRAALHSLLPQNVPVVDICLERLLYFSASSCGMGRNEAEERMERILGFSGLREFSSVPVSRMSGGERQLAFLAFMLMRQSRAYYLDEPEAPLDAGYKLKAESAMKMLKDDGHAVLVSMHDINRTLSFADRILVLERGRLVFDGDPESFISSGCGSTYFGLEFKNLTDGEGNMFHLFL